MKTISITAFNRPEYLKRTLNTLSLNVLRGYDKLYCGIEPGNQEVFEICRDIKFIPTEIILNEEIYGVRKNPYKLLDRLFDDGSEFNVYLEDDIDLSPDAIELANFFYKNFKNDEFMGCSFHNYNSSKSDKSKCIAIQEMVAIAFALFKTAWTKWWKPNWFSDEIAKEYKIGGIGWDWSIRAALRKYNKQFLTPIYSRVTHTGRFGGIHCNPQDHIRLFSDKPFCKSNIGGFHL